MGMKTVTCSSCVFYQKTPGCEGNEDQIACDSFKSKTMGIIYCKHCVYATRGHLHGADGLVIPAIKCTVTGLIEDRENYCVSAKVRK